VDDGGRKAHPYLSKDERTSNLKRIAKMKRFVPSDYEQILGPYLDTHENMRYCSYVHEKRIGRRRARGMAAARGWDKTRGVVKCRI
jgi:hypothetical protein